MVTVTFEEMRTEEEKKIDSEVLERVKRGMRLLEEKHGADWVDHINVETLDIASCGQCILGQLYGHYDTGREKLNLRGWKSSQDYEDRAADYGFNAHIRDRENIWTELQEAWVESLTPLVRKEG